MKYVFAIIGIVALIIIFIGLPIFFNATPAGRTAWNNWFLKVEKADDATNYETIKQVEDTCRSMIVSYESDKLMYEQYRDSDNEEKLSWAEQAKMRANKTAISYNDYIIKNSFVWKDNIPDDIKMELPIIS